MVDKAINLFTALTWLIVNSNRFVFVIVTYPDRIYFTPEQRASELHETIACNISWPLRVKNHCVRSGLHNSESSKGHIDQHKFPADRKTYFVLM